MRSVLGSRSEMTNKKTVRAGRKDGKKKERTAETEGRGPGMHAFIRGPYQNNGQLRIGGCLLLTWQRHYCEPSIVSWSIFVLWLRDCGVTGQGPSAKETDRVEADYSGQTGQQCRCIKGSAKSHDRYS